ncbi:mycofactocin-coupled SDR family oxidoreductase [Trujillonella endophytica]|uniref:SDR family mycofactocin-dependent oxidoreductase n=1 Tax=Trujillonella endophytica TaxID=673521 RepID=A0A1H8V4G0_9ACTN|nr:mycofactocin-coupled SDR family oxidoreductase [Trujillella endophytica]SEP10319.1 SDR family mycofactocin-dependent oxidoreductase [Trujillella endophytica]
MAGRLEGKVAFITGAARGQGRSHAVRLAEEGADIIAVDACGPVPENTVIPPATPEDLEETVRLVEALDRRIIATKADVRDFDALKAAVDAGVQELGRLDVVSASAGIGNGGQKLDFTTEYDWQEMLDVNLSGVWKTVKAAVPHIKAGKRGGSIILTGSVGGLKAVPNTGQYTVAKHGVVGLMRMLAVELGKYSIRVNCVHPTNVNTPMFINEGTMKLFRPDLENPTPADMDVAARGMHVLPIGMVEAVDISNAVLFLASDEARYVTGLNLTVDAGATLK